MAKTPNEIIYSDILVIGTGVAGLYFSIEIEQSQSINIITKKNSFDTNTNFAQGGIASVLDDSDNFESHIQDTLNAGDGLCNADAVKLLVHKAPEQIKRLIKLGVSFTNLPDNSLALAREGGHEKSRIVHAKDYTGMAVETCLLDNIHQRKNIQLFEHHCSIDLITTIHSGIGSHKNTCCGVYVLDIKNDKIKIFLAKNILLATGGAGQIYSNTTNPNIATGDGVAMAYRAGCQIANLEFYQFHPTTLYQEVMQDKAFLLTEALRGHGAKLRLPDGSRFMHNYDEREELAPRDIVARAIDAECKKNGLKYLFLDVRNFAKGEIEDKFPNVFNNCLRLGLDIRKVMIPVVPAAHYMCGGIVTDLVGRTGLNNLFATGEVSCTGVHGANRLASNSILEGLVYSQSAAMFINKNKNNLSNIAIDNIPAHKLNWQHSGEEDPREKLIISHNISELKKIMQDYVGIVRTNKMLKRALKHIDLIYEETVEIYNSTRLNINILDLRNLVLFSQLIVRSALKRKESRGLNFNLDYPFKLKNAEYTILQNTNL